MAVRRPLIIDGGSIKELPSGDTLPAPGKTAATLTHSGGVVTLDVQAADLYRFEADAYVAGGAVSVVAETNTSSKSATFALPATPLEGDVVVVIMNHASSTEPTLPAGYVKVRGEANSGGRFAVGYKEMGATPDTTIDLTGLGNAPHSTIILLRDVDTAQPQDAAHQFTNNWTAASIRPDPPAITTVSDDALVVCAMFSFNNITGITVTGYTVVTNDWDASGNSHLVRRKNVAVAGSEDPATSGSNSTYWVAITTAWRSKSPSGEKDYTFTFSNIPASRIAEGLIDVELKTDTGSIAFAGGTVTWRGTEPTFDAVGRYLIGFIADATGITLWREG